MKTKLLLFTVLCLSLSRFSAAQTPCTAGELKLVSVQKDFPCEASFGTTTYVNFVSITVDRRFLKTGLLEWQFRADSVNGSWQPVSNSWSGQGTESIGYLYFSTADNGEYRVVFTDTSTGCKDFRKVTVTVFPRPLPSIAIDSSSCDGLFLGAHDANNLSGLNNTYCWGPDYSSIPINCASTNNYLLFDRVGCAMVAGNVAVIVTNEFGCEGETFTTGLCNIEYMDIRADLSSLSNVFCANTESINITRNSGAGFGNNWTFQWQKDGTNLNWAQSPSIKPATSGNYSCLVSNGSGCTKTTDPIFVTVFPRPSATLAPAGSVQICQTDTLTLLSNATGTNTYQWYRNNAPFSTAGPDLSTSLSGNYKLLVTNNFGCTRLTSTTKVSKYRTTIAANGPVVFCQGDSVILFSTTTNTASWQWQLNNVNIPGATGSSYAAKSAGLYRVRGLSTEGCRSYSNQLDVNVNCRESLAANNSLQLSPVPVSSILNVSIPENTTEGIMEIYMPDGKLIDRRNLQTISGTSSLQIDVRGYTAGIYLLRIIHGSTIYQGKFIKE
jgi:hypothetical protein